MTAGPRHTFRDGEFRVEVYAPASPNGKWLIVGFLGGREQTRARRDSEKLALASARGMIRRAGGEA